MNKGKLMLMRKFVVPTNVYLVGDNINDLVNNIDGDLNFRYRNFPCVLCMMDDDEILYLENIDRKISLETYGSLSVLNESEFEELKGLIEDTNIIMIKNFKGELNFGLSQNNNETDEVIYLSFTYDSTNRILEVIDKRFNGGEPLYSNLVINGSFMDIIDENE